MPLKDHAKEIAAAINGMEDGDVVCFRRRGGDLDLEILKSNTSDTIRQICKKSIDSNLNLLLACREPGMN